MHKLNSYYLQIFYIPKAHKYLSDLCTIAEKDKKIYLNFSTTQLALMSFEEISKYQLNWRKKLSGTNIELDWLGHTSESKNELGKIVKQFLYLQKIAMQNKRQKLLKLYPEKKNNIEMQIKTFNQILVEYEKRIA